jgi:hypothetical protein
MADETDRPMTDEERALARRGEERIAAAVAEVQAPQSLRESIERTRASAQRRAPFWRRPRWAIAAMGAVAAAAVVAVVALDQSDTAAPSLQDVYAAAGATPAQAAPARIGGDPPVLDQSVGAIEFPDWKSTFGWEAVGSRETQLDGREVTTVVYRNPDGARLGYAVVGGVPIAETPAGTPIRRAGNTYRVDEGGGHTTVSWTQQGHTCVIVAPTTVPRRTLVELAASRNPPARPS